MVATTTGMYLIDPARRLACCASPAPLRRRYLSCEIGYFFPIYLGFSMEIGIGEILKIHLKMGRFAIALQLEERRRVASEGRERT